MGIPSGEDRSRFICSDCGFIHYLNPRMIVGTLPFIKNQVLLCKRAIEPRYGFWTLPCGFLENGESAQDGALRETMEEANAQVEILTLHTLYSVIHVNQVYMIFLARLTNLNFFPGSESLETKLFSHDEIPWDNLAFSSIRFSLEMYTKDFPQGSRFPYLGSIDKK